jgi:protein involved in polysaccharide export with SLBB domain
MLPSSETPSFQDEQVVGVALPIDSVDEPEVMTTGRRGAVAAGTDLPLEEPLDPLTYICGSGDAFELRFWGRQNLSIRVSVDLEGSAFIPKIGNIRVAGKTLAESRSLILAEVRRYYPGLHMDLSLVKPRHFIVHVVGEVKKPGVYRSNPRERLSALMARVGDPSGSIRRIEIRHRDGKTSRADLLLYSRTGQSAQNPYLLDGDVVTVPRPELEVAIHGPVRHPGRYELIATRDLAELIHVAGGLETSASHTLPIEVTHRDRQERRVTRRLAFDRGGRAPNIKLGDDDEVVVPSDKELDRTVMLMGAVLGADQADPATTIKRMSFSEGDTVRSLVERAGGVTVSADLANSYIRRAGKKMEPVDLEALLVRRDFSADRQVAVGDVVVIPFRRRSVTVEGAVVRAGAFQFDPRMGLEEYLASAGGPTRYAQDPDEIRIIGANGRSRHFSRGLQVQPGDTIVVPERHFSRSEVVQLVMSGAGIVLSAVALSYSLSR